jgi:hypothetical protein
MSYQLDLPIDSTQSRLTASVYLNKTDFPIPGIIQIGSEKISYTNLTDLDFLGCTRGYAGTTAVSHNKGVYINFVSVIPTVATDVTSLHADTEANLVGDVTLLSGTNVTLSQVGQEITIDAAGGGGVSNPMASDLDAGTNDITNLGSLQLNDDAPLFLDTASNASFNFDQTNFAFVLTSGGSPVSIGPLGAGHSVDIVTDVSYAGDFAAITISSLAKRMDVYSDVGDILRLDSSITAGETRMLVWDVDNATLSRVSVGADDSGGTGYKVLRIPN